MARELHELLIKPGEPLIFGATGITDILQCLRVIVTTIAYSVPMDRAFANSGKLVDAPAPCGVDMLLAEIMDAIGKYEPRVRVRAVSLSGEGTASDLMDGRVFPVVTFEIKEGVEL